MKRGKIFCVLSILTWLFLISFVSGATCSNDDRIMKLHKATNSHGALWDYSVPGDSSAYTKNICYKTIFGEFYEGRAGEDVHECTPNTNNPNNVILWLSKEGNSHASINKVPGKYNVPVCYGNLDCRVRTEGDCMGDEELVVKLSKRTNSHLSAKGIDADDKNDYDKLICCSHIDQYWADMNWGKIEEADKKDTVRMILEKNALRGKELRYEVYKKGNLNWNPYYWFDWKVDSQTSNKGFALWKAGQTSENVFNQGDYYFKVAVDGQTISSENKLNGILNVGAGSNAMPTTQIDGPDINSKHGIRIIGGIYKTSDIDFLQTSTDEDDDLKVTWNFGDGDNEEFENVLTSDDANPGDTTHAYSRESGKGTNRVVLTAKEMTRNQRVKDYSRVYVYEAGFNIFSVINMFRVIDESGTTESIPYDEPTQDAGNFKIEGSGSYVSKCFYDGNKEQCKTENSGQDCERVENLWCYNVVNPDIGFVWTVNDVSVGTDSFIEKSEEKAGAHEIDLKVSYTSPDGLIDDETYVDLIILGGIKCADDYTKWLDYRVSPFREIYTVGTGENCYHNVNEVAFGSTECCPSGYKCVETEESDSGGNLISNCEFKNEYRCSDYDTEQDCRTHNPKVAIDSVEFLGGICGRGESNNPGCYIESDCICEWDVGAEPSEDGVTYNCVAKSEEKEICNDIPDPVREGICTWTLSKWDDKCSEDGFIYASWKPEKDGNYEGECEDIVNRQISCESVVKLDFFGWFNFVVSVLILIVVYGFYIRKQNVE